MSSDFGEGLAFAFWFVVIGIAVVATAIGTLIGWLFL